MHDQNNALTPISVPGTDRQIMATLVDGKPAVSVRHACAAIGIDYSSQIRNLKRWSWATVVTLTMVGADGKPRDMTAVDRRTFTSWLTHIDASRVSDEARPIVEQFQAEAADALDAYFNEGGAINPNATADQVDALMDQVERRLRILRLTDGLVDANWLETKIRHQVAVALDEEPEIEARKRTLTVSDYLDQKGLTDIGQRKFAPTMGGLVKKQFREAFNREPGKAVRFVNGADREVAAYTEANRNLFDQAWRVIGPAIESQYFRDGAA